jgi:PAS domain S-box-containing protein
MTTNNPQQQSIISAVVIHDNQGQNEYFSGLLRKEGFNVQSYGSAESALECMNRQTPPGLIVANLYMPGIDGWRLCRLLRSSDYLPFNKVPILVVSATWANDEVVNITTEAGANAFLSLPVGEQEFRKQVQELLHGEQSKKLLQVLIVEDDQNLAALIKHAFEKYSYNAETALTGTEAEIRLKTKAYDVVVIDHHMPDIKGDQLLVMFQQIQPEAVYLAITGDSNPDLALEWMKQGAAAFVRKPFDPLYLIELCNRARREKELLRMEQRLKNRTQELRQSEERFAAFMTNLPAAAFIKDEDGRTLFANQYLQELFNFQNWSGKTTCELIPGDAGRKMAEDDRRVIRQGRFEAEETITDSKGDVRTYKSIKFPIRVEGGPPLLGGISVDISERRRMEQALWESRTMLKLVLDAVPQAIFWKDRDGRYLGCNMAFAGAVGMEDPAQIVGKTDFDLPWPRNEAEAYRADDREVLENNHPKYHIIEPLQQADGTRLWIDTSKIPIIDELGRPFAVMGVYDNITERKKMEEALVKERLLIDSLLQSLPGIFYLYTYPELRLIRWNKNHEILLGFKPEEMKNRSIFDWHPPGAREMVQQAVEVVMEKGQNSLESPLLTKDGRSIWFLMTGMKLQIDDARYLLGVGLDVSERRRTEEALKAETIQRRVLFERSPDGIVIIDPDSARFLDFNTAAHEHLGYSREEFAQLSIFEVEVQETKNETEAHIANVIRDGRADFNTLQRTRLGEIRNVHVTAQYIVVMNRQVYYCIWRDITEQKRAEVALRESEEKFRSVVESSPMAMHFYRLDDEGRLIFMGANSTADKFMEIEHRPLIGKTLGEAFPKLLGTDIPEIYRKLARGELGSQFFEIPYHDERFSGVYEVHAFQTGPKAMAAAFLDISNRRRLEEQLSHSQKMESIGRLAGGVAHDFNNMLGAILGNVDLALQDLPLDNPLRESLEEIEKCARRSADLTRQLLAFARKQTVAPKVLDLNFEVETMLKMLRRLIGEDIDLVWQPAPNLWRVKMDPSQINQILANLCVNARDAIHGVGKVTMETGNISVDETYAAEHPNFAPGDYVLLALSDNGAGMDKKVLEHLFEPFFTTKGLGQGTGLGLSTVYGIVRQNNGYINVYSEPKQGTTFKIYIPRHVDDGASVPSSGSVHYPAPRGQETILLVEDELSLLRISKRTLESMGYMVLAASTPAEAIALAKDHPGQIHLLMTDVVMPEMNGRELAKRLLSFYPKLKCLFMSGYTANVIAHHGVLDKGINFIQKPFTFKDLSEKLRQALMAD